MKLLLALMFFSSVHAQINTTKALFFDLPIDKPKSEVITKIKTDTTLFRIIDRVFKLDGVERRNQGVFAEVKKYHTDLPKPCKYPSLSITNKLFYLDTVFQKNYYTISLMLTYEKEFGSFENAKQAFSLIVTTIEKEYKIKLDNDPFVGKNKITFKNDPLEDFCCSVEIRYKRVRKNNKPDDSRCFIYVTYWLQEN